MDKRNGYQMMLLLHESDLQILLTIKTHTITSLNMQIFANYSSTSKLPICTEQRRSKARAVTAANLKKPGVSCCLSALAAVADVLGCFLSARWATRRVGCSHRSAGGSAAATGPPVVPGLARGPIQAAVLSWPA